LHSSKVTLKRQSNKQAWSTFNLGRKLFTTIPAFDHYLTDLLSEICNNKQRVVEYGCGDGIWLEYLAQKFPDNQFVGVEWTDRLYEYAKNIRLKNLQNIKLYHKDATTISVDCDFFYSLGVLEHFSDAVAVLKSWTEHLAPNGFALTIVPNLLNTIYNMQRFQLTLDQLKGKKEVVHNCYGFEQLWSHNTILKIVMEAGLEVLLFRVVEENKKERPMLIVAFKREI